MDRSAGGLWPKFWERRNLGGHFDQGGGGVGEGHKGGTLAFLPWSFPPPLPPSLPDLGGLLVVVVVVAVEITREEPAFLRWSLSSLSIYQPLPKTTCHPRV